MARDLLSRTFVRFQNRTHLVTPIGGNEHTLCGIANDAHASEQDPSLRWVAILGRIPVSCEACAAVVRYCRSVQIA